MSGSNKLIVSMMQSKGHGALVKALMNANTVAAKKEGKVTKKGSKK